MFRRSLEICTDRFQFYPNLLQLALNLQQNIFHQRQLVELNKFPAATGPGRLSGRKSNGEMIFLERGFRFGDHARRIFLDFEPYQVFVDVIMHQVVDSKPQRRSQQDVDVRVIQSPRYPVQFRTVHDRLGKMFQEKFPGRYP